MKNKLLILPILLFTVLFILLPLVYIVGMSFMEKDELWGVQQIFTFENYKAIVTPVYLKTFLSSLTVAFTTTVITAFIGYPFGYIMSKLPRKKRDLYMMLLVIPFWTNSLIRIYGWVILLKGGGILSNILSNLGIINEPLDILYTFPAVIIGMVYSLLPFMILAVYSSCLKLDTSLNEAARDLGAGKIRTFCDITLRLTLPGLLSGITLVFIPSMGLFFISDLLGGGKIMLLGNLIERQLTSSRNLPFGAALSVIMIFMTLLILWGYKKISGTSEVEGLI